MSAQHSPGPETKTARIRRLRSQRIDSPAFRRGVRAFKTGAGNPYNGPELRDFWEAGREYARICAETEAEFAAIAKAQEGGAS